MSVAFNGGIELFNRGLYWEAHEAWEWLWRIETTPERKLFLQGLIQLAAALHHLFEKQHPEPAKRLLDRALSKLDQLPATYDGLDLLRARADARASLHALQLGDPAERFTLQPFRTGV